MKITHFNLEEEENGFSVKSLKQKNDYFTSLVNNKYNYLVNYQPKVYLLTYEFINNDPKSNVFISENIEDIERFVKEFLNEKSILWIYLFECPTYYEAFELSKEHKESNMLNGV